MTATLFGPAADVIHSPLFSKALSTLLLLVAATALQFLLRRFIDKHLQDDSDERRRWVVQARNAVVLLVLAGLLVIWGTQLRTLAISLIAVTAAIVLATKELIMCVSGGLVRGTSRSFQIGDRIEVNGLRGDVSDQRILTTTILEVGPGETTHQYTGRTITIPNSVFLTAPVRNETLTNDYVLHTFRVPIEQGADWRRIERELLAIANQECSGYLAEARRHLERVGEEQGLRALSAEPRVTLSIPDPGKLHLLVRLPAPARRRGRLEDAILRRLLERVDLRAPPPPPKPERD